MNHSAIRKISITHRIFKIARFLVCNIEKHDNLDSLRCLIFMIVELYIHQVLNSDGWIHLDDSVVVRPIFLKNIFISMEGDGVSSKNS